MWENPMRSGRLAAVAICAFAMPMPAVIAQASALTLVTAREAALPDAPDTQPPPGRDLFPPPDVVQLSPTPNGETTLSPFALKIGFKPHNGATVAVPSIKLVYLKVPEIDLTPKIQHYISADGIAIPDAKFPPGTHKILVIVADSDGNTNRVPITLVVRQK